MVPMAMPLYCTLLPLVRPVTGSRKTTSYSRQLLSEAYFAAHRPKPSRNSDTRIVTAPIRTQLASVSMLRAGIAASDLGLRKACSQPRARHVCAGWIWQTLSPHPPSPTTHPLPTHPPPPPP